MAKPLNERIASARATDRVTITDLKGLIKEARQEHARQLATMEAAETDSADIALSEADRDEAAANASRAERTAKAYADALVDLEGKLKAKVEGEKQQAIETEKTAAIADRDHLAERFRKFGPPMFAELVEILGLIEANAKRLKRAGLRDSLTAEHLARGLGHFVGHSPVQLFAQMKIPAWAGAGRAWPHSDFVNPAAVGVYDPKAVERQRAANIEKHRATWGRYRLDPAGKQNVKFVERKPHPMRGKQRNLHEDFGPVEVDLDHAEAERLRGLGVKAERLKDQVSDADLIFY